MITLDLISAHLSAHALYFGLHGFQLRFGLAGLIGRKRRRNEDKREDASPPRLKHRLYNAGYLMERLIEYLGNHPWLGAAAIAMLVLVVIYEMRSRSENASAVSPQEAIRLMNNGALVLDIRPQAQFATGHLNGARQLPADQILTAGETLKKHREKPVLVYCETGSLSAAAARQLATQGFTKASNLRGGIAAWRAENLPVARS